MKSTHRIKSETTSKDRFASVENALRMVGGLSPPKSSKGFGSSALWTDGKMFAFLSSKGELVLKLPKTKVDSLISSGDGERCELKKGRPMKEWVVLSPKSEFNWLDLAYESAKFVRSQI